VEFSHALPSPGRCEDLDHPIHHAAGSNASTGLLEIGKATSYSNPLSLSFAGFGLDPAHDWVVGLVIVSLAFRGIYAL